MKKIIKIFYCKGCDAKHPVDERCVICRKCPQCCDTNNICDKDGYTEDLGEF